MLLSPLPPYDLEKKKICPDKSLMNAGMKDNAIRK